MEFPAIFGTRSSLGWRFVISAAFIVFITLFQWMITASMIERDFGLSTLSQLIIVSAFIVGLVVLRYYLPILLVVVSVVFVCMFFLMTLVVMIVGFRSMSGMSFYVLLFLTYWVTSFCCQVTLLRSFFPYQS